jgi:hypothetical protein
VGVEPGGRHARAANTIELRASRQTLVQALKQGRREQIP